MQMASRGNRTETRAAASLYLLTPQMIEGRAANALALSQESPHSALRARGAKPGQAVAVDRILPGEKLFNREHVAPAHVFQRNEPAVHSRLRLLAPGGRLPAGELIMKARDVMTWGIISVDPDASVERAAS